eukprot:TRINITY_DN33244_c0_g1_i1.p1 TRINITY_DN33244_c0_g1~~TRINITY_DN33244_c0_g1_i1.p1  ORF type:complete len:181 (-),score=33.85 TRINITY_DN33244_c0_g1_i1:2-523(-)
MHQENEVISALKEARRRYFLDATRANLIEFEQAITRQAENTPLPTESETSECEIGPTVVGGRSKEISECGMQTEPAVGDCAVQCGNEKIETYVQTLQDTELPPLPVVVTYLPLCPIAKDLLEACSLQNAALDQQNHSPVKIFTEAPLCATKQHFSEKTRLQLLDKVRAYNTTY